MVIQHIFKIIFIAGAFFIINSCANKMSSNIENGLIGPVVISEKSQTMNLEERMRHYNLDIISKENTLFLYDPNSKTKKRLYLRNNQCFFVLEEAFEIEYLQDEKQINIHFQDGADDIDTLVKVNND